MVSISRRADAAMSEYVRARLQHLLEELADVAEPTPPGQPADPNETAPVRPGPGAKTVIPVPEPSDEGPSPPRRGTAVAATPTQQAGSAGSAVAGAHRMVLPSDRLVPPRHARIGVGGRDGGPVADRSPAVAGPSQLTEPVELHRRAKPAEPASVGTGIDRTEVIIRAREFARSHVVVIGVVMLVGLVLTGALVLRARPVAIGQPTQSASPDTAGSGAPPSTSSRPTPGGRGTATSTPRPPILVHVLGAVRTPGVVQLAQGARVQDAIRAAGGLTKNAEPGQLNLAQVLTDGQQVIVGTTGDPAGRVSGGQPGDASSGSAAPTEQIDLNTASKEQLESLPGVGPVTAASIVAWRGEHGRFSRIEELQEVDGIGPKTYAQIAPHVRV